MIEESLLQSNFLGRDGFRWWIGQIPTIDSWSEQAEGAGWGIRYKVRIMGYHPYDKSILSDQDLPWAGCLLPVTAGSGAAKFSSSSKIRQGDVVIGFFLDGDNSQIPMIMGTFGKTNQVVPIGDGSTPFVPFSGYTSTIPEKATSVIGGSGEVSGQGADGQDTARALDQQGVSKVNEKNNSKKAPREAQEHSTIGRIVVMSDTCEDNFASEVTGVLENLVNVLGESTNFFSDVQSSVSKIQNLSRGFVSNLMNGLYEELIPILTNGMNSLFNDVFSSTLKALGNIPGANEIAEAAGLDAQEALLGPIKNLQDNFSCVVTKVVSGIYGTIQDMLESTLLEVVNFGVCVAEQFLGGLLDKILDQLESAIEPILETLSKIMDPLFKAKDFLLSGVNLIKSTNNFLQCGQKPLCPSIKTWTLGYGPKNRDEIDKVLDNALKQANMRKVLSGITTLTSPYTKPDCGTPSECSPPEVSFFGGSGSGATGRAILGSFVNNTPGLSEVTESLTRTASIIGVEITDPGSGYGSAPPIITFEDPCRNGYGAIARAIVDYDRTSSTFGQVTGAYIVSDGENYPGNVDDEDITVVDVHILKPGEGYDNNDIVSDSEGNEYSITVDNGRIVSVSPINTKKISTLPNILIDSSNGDGALLRPLLGRYKPQTEVIEVIDCVT